MSNSSPKKLHLVPYQPSDYSLGEALGKEHGTVSNDERFIAAALSLYFQWEDYRSCVGYFDLPALAVPLECMMDYDRDEREPSELKVSVNRKKNSTNFNEVQNVLLRFEVFRTCYEFSARILGVSEQDKEKIELIIEPPQSITTFKTRRLPRVKVRIGEAGGVDGIAWISEKKPEIIFPLELVEIGMASFRALLSEEIPDGKGALLINSSKIPGELLKKTANGSIFSVDCSEIDNFGRYYDFFRRVAYPYLRERDSFPAEVILSLYVRSGYLDKICDTDLAQHLATVKELWSEAVPGKHKSTIDLVAIDDEGNPCGASSATLSFYRGNEPVWAFHQLCALKKPDLLERSGQLYTWRAEYLAARPEDLSVVVWFDGKSRWLERIYLKFSSQASSSTQVRSVIMRSKKFGVSSSDALPSGVVSYEVGNHKRYVSKLAEDYIGAEPELLNLSGTLNAVVALDSKSSPEELHRIAASFANIAEKEVLITFTVPEDFPNPEVLGEAIKEDFGVRFASFAKKDLVGFMSAVDHSVAITKRKLSEG